MSVEPKTGNFKAQISAYFKQQTLSAAQLKHLQALEGKPKSTTWLLASAASCLLAATVYIYMFTGINYSAISKEIAYNHNSQMQMEVVSSSIDDIQQHLNRLDFNLIDSSQLDQQQWELLGGRYCSIGGRIAAQLKVRNRQSQQVHTFYQAKLPDEWLNITQQKELNVDGVTVKVWQEKGLLIGLAK
ncbi:hypothetical protein AHAT_37760 [Agarivorans sp. Toyoura001]|uniref:hypothetical protein n=1 Tax=Agarivorans sp. Toyoura001 TaxID=2283141 RepID=UPI0010E41593|nr:hypothetical protein [Agarivorans sp. Toyoura001]GDY27886.1 hypothetical protein AHAT_37760 [Agarivorans sp. Toyoura001]